ncbi:MAG: CBS domain-containing protein [Burkholderiales bacterium]|nr:MAG: CBS domain-containing protein [Burkholderiales bacterium]
MQVKQILQVKGTTLFTVAPETLLSDGVVTMAEHDIGSLVVMDRGKLAGMLTFREVLQTVARSRAPTGGGAGSSYGDITVAEVMNPQPTAVGPETDVNELRRLMLENHQRYLPVMEDTILLGVVSFHDVARAVLEEHSFENRMLKAYIRDWPAEG